MREQGGFSLTEEGCPLVNGQHNPGNRFLNIDSCRDDVKILNKGDVIEMSLYDNKPAPEGMLYNIKGTVRYKMLKDIYSNGNGQVKIRVNINHEIWDNTAIKRVRNVKQD